MMTPASVTSAGEPLSDTLTVTSYLPLPEASKFKSTKGFVVFTMSSTVASQPATVGCVKSKIFAGVCDAIVNV